MDDEIMVNKFWVHLLEDGSNFVDLVNVEPEHMEESDDPESLEDMVKSSKNIDDRKKKLALETLEWAKYLGVSLYPFFMFRGLGYNFSVDEMINILSNVTCDDLYRELQD